ncbi:PREDICTED: IQ domain-containing protein D [Ficedula albicollis]|uniref:Dynein regulatory complex protein 10 n=1 Tax=Ficedula albicollis TaxID=59894 RepID=U3JWP6_FICAL|nr:PREDICTED: IQ domain-containing protein D [Ficedula albicollis]XP_016157662.1 PREDICTED: IQ domain-containing protein D [Ficedula albicollis]XP_016157663.1 PREDICTED: IQ domain-containing protein D [Ficedula albicollis]
MATPRKAEIPLDTMKVLDPRQLKPDSTETERILTVLDETIVKLEITRLILRIIGSLERYAKMLGPEITSSLLEHQKLSMEVEQLLSSPGGEESRIAVEQRLKCSLRNILRLFLANPLLYHGLKYEVRLRESPADVFIKAFMEFRDFTLERLLTGPEEEKEKIRFLEDTSLQVEKNTEMISALQEELAEAIQTRDEEVKRKDETIENLKTTIENLAKGCKADIQQIMMEGEKQQKEDEEASHDRCARLKQDIERLRAHYNALVLKHRASEMVLRKEKCKTEREIQKWVQKYDTDMSEKQAAFEELQAAYKQEKEQLAVLMEKHALLLQEYTEIEEERRVLKEKEEEAARLEARRNEAATCIQAFWRGYLVRSVYKSKLKKAKGKGKGKGKK